MNKRRKKCIKNDVIKNGTKLQIVNHKTGTKARLALDSAITTENGFC